MSSHTDYDLELLTFPCRYPIKAFAKSEHAVEVLLAEILRYHAGTFAEEDIKARESSKGTYRSVTITFEASSKSQLDAIYASIRSEERLILGL